MWFLVTFFSCPCDSNDQNGYTFFTNEKCLDFTSPGMEVAMTFSVGYFILDCITVKQIFGSGRLTYETIFHHLIGIVGLTSAILIGRACGILAMSLMITEISTIFLNVRSIMKELNIDDDEKYKTIFVTNGICLMISFFLSRIIFLGVIIFGFVVPTIIYYDYDSARKDVG